MATPSARMRGSQTEELAMRMRRPPTEYVSLLSQTEREFRSYVDTLETNPAFERLMSDGLISRVRLRGKIPREKYEEFMDEQMMDYLSFYGITHHDGWEKDFLSQHALERAPEIANKYGAPIGDTLRFLRYLTSTGSGGLSGVLSRGSGGRSGGGGDEERSPTMEDTVAGGALVDLGEVIETTRDFVERYEVSEQEFLDYVLGGEYDADEIAEKFGCSLREAEEVLEAADRVYMAQGYEASGMTPDKKAAPARAVTSNDEPVAFVSIKEGDLAIQFHNDSIYTQRYRIKPGALKELKKEAPEDARDLLMRARYINQRLSALSRLITTLCQSQTDYLGSGDARQLKPLAQAALARDLGEHPSMVSRLIRGKHIETPWGKIPLLFLCQSKTDVVARLIAQHPQLTDQEVVSKLREEYDCHIARRTVAYHRGKRLRRNKRRKKPEA
ncbi:hypothetical protein EON83_04000 [bacterium]|nr:MAG: hypothetical protein EON83_04000 [bacterium]